MSSSTARVPVAKTYKIYIGGKFPRTESGRYFALTDNAGAVSAESLAVHADTSEPH